MQLVEKAHKKQQAAIFENVVQILKERLHLYKFRDCAFDQSDLLEHVDAVVKQLKNCRFKVQTSFMEHYIEEFDELAALQPNENTQMAIKLLGSSACFGVSYRKLCRKIWKWVIVGAVITFSIFMLMKEKSEPLTEKDAKIIEFLEIFKPNLLKEGRDAGLSDKQIVQYVLEKTQKKNLVRFYEIKKTKPLFFHMEKPKNYNKVFA